MKTKLLLILALGLALRAAAQTPVEQAAAALKAGDLAAAESILVPLAAAPNPEAEVLHQLGMVRLRQKKSVEAIELAERSVKLAPDKAEYHSQLGLALVQRMGEVGFMQQAMISGRLRKAYERTLELDPNHIGGLIGLTRYFSNAPEIAGGSLEKAKGFATRLRQINPRLGEAELGLIAEREENFAEALARYEATVALQPDHGWPHYQCGRMLVKLDRKDEARARFETAVRNDPKLEQAKQALAELAAKPAEKG